MLSVYFLLALCVAQSFAIPPHMKEMLPAELLDLIYRLRNACSSKHGLTDDEIDTYVITNTEQKFKCYMDCMMVNANWMTADGTINYDIILAETHTSIKPILERAFGKCRSIPDSSEPCEKAFSFNVCLQGAEPDHYFLP